MSDRFDFLEIGDEGRSRVRRRGPGDGSSPPGPRDPPIGGCPMGGDGKGSPPRTWRVVETIGGRGNGPGQFIGPQGLTVDRLGNLYVADAGNNRIQRIAPDGGVAVLDAARGAPREPVGVAVDDALNFYVLERGYPTISAFSWQGEPRWRWTDARKRSPIEALQSSSGLATDRENALLLLDTGAGRIIRLRLPEARGRPLIAEEIRHPAIERPRGVCADAGGRLFLGEANRPEVVALQRGSTGVWEMAWKRSLVELGFKSTSGVLHLAMDREGGLLAALPFEGMAFLSAEDGSPRRVELQGIASEPTSGCIALARDGSLYTPSAHGRIYRLQPSS